MQALYRASSLFSQGQMRPPQAMHFGPKIKERSYEDEKQGENISQCGHEILPEMLPAAYQRPKYVVRRVSSITSLVKIT